MTDTSANLTIDDREEAMQLFGTRDQYLKMIRDALGVRVVMRGEVLHIEGTATQVDQAERAFAQLRSMLATHKVLTAENVRTVLAIVSTAEDRPSASTLATAV